MITIALLLVALAAFVSGYIAALAIQWLRCRQSERPRFAHNEFDRMVDATLRNRGAEIADNAMRQNKLMQRLKAEGGWPPRKRKWGFW